MSDTRIVSLIPSATEIVCALGLGDALVGRSHECDFPDSVRSLPVCTRARFADGSSREIDDRVRSLVREGLSVYDVETDVLRRLSPTTIVTQDQCDVCAVSLSDVEAALRSLSGGPVDVVSLAPSTLGDVWRDVVRVGEATGVGETARALAARLAGRVSEVGERTGDVARPRVACIEWLDPWMTAGNWVPELVAIAGGEALLAQTGRHSERLDEAALAHADPDVIVVMPCGFDLDRTGRELAAQRTRPAWRALRAVREGRVYLTDANAYFNRPGPRLVESLEILAEILHPDRFPARHRGSGWLPAA